MLINDDPKGALVPNTPYGKALEMWFDKKYYNFLKELEQTFGCSSACVIPLFSLTKNLEQGLPTNECIRGLFTRSTA